MKAIRNAYAEQGVENYYQTQGNVYQNPHFPFIRQLLRQNEGRIDYTYIFDFCAGGGEATLAVKELGYSDQIGCDPFTSDLYVKNTDKTCWSLSFEDVVKGKLAQFEHVLAANNWEKKPFSSTVCSFAMHLCPEKLLFSLTEQLFKVSEKNCHHHASQTTCFRIVAKLPIRF
ncbi:MAG: hypothetical protein HC817_04825 [Saprospiraceae bacterium]|nr:hypothetical protein [Saprospiraceae bacterium]